MMQIAVMSADPSQNLAHVSVMELSVPHLTSCASISQKPAPATRSSRHDSRRSSAGGAAGAARKLEAAEASPAACGVSSGTCRRHRWCQRWEQSASASLVAVHACASASKQAGRICDPSAASASCLLTFPPDCGSNQYRHRPTLCTPEKYIHSTD